MAKSYVKGGGKLRKALREMPLEISDEVRAAVKEGADAVLADALKGAPKPGMNPYATGELVSMLSVRPAKNGLSARVGSWGKGRAAHIHLIEFGVQPHDIKMPNGGVIHHPGHKAQPFLFPAYYANRNWAIARIREAVTKALDKAGRKLRGSEE
ncbi:MAG TPA: HK97-gp10 family putative phage morphogenesis protein [Azospirillum sp.]|nr:HK97-gp10 family putative phage morphogenesis protein [Azospirillum sp.]